MKKLTTLLLTATIIGSTSITAMAAPFNCKIYSNADLSKMCTQNSNNLNNIFNNLNTNNLCQNLNTNDLCQNLKSQNINELIEYIKGQLNCNNDFNIDFILPNDCQNNNQCNNNSQCNNLNNNQNNNQDNNLNNNQNNNQDNNLNNSQNNSQNNNLNNNQNNINMSEYAKKVIDLVNEEREKNGLSPLATDAKVTQAAQLRAEEIKTLFSHTRPNGTQCFTALKEAGVNYSGAGENIAMGQKTPEEVMQGWMNSSGHRANILKAEFKNIGVGYYVDSNGKAHWTQFFTY